MDSIILDVLGILDECKVGLTHIHTRIEDLNNLVQNFHEYKMKLGKDKEVKEEVAKAFSKININRITHIISKNTCIDAYVLMDNNDDSEPVRKELAVRLSQAMLLLGEKGFVQVDRFVSVNSLITTFRNESNQVIVSKNINFRVKNAFINNVKKAFKIDEKPE